MEIGAVAHIGEHVLFVCERRQSHPVHAFPSHLGEARRGGTIKGGHPVTADPGRRPTAFWKYRRAVVGTSRTEEGLAERWRHRQRLLIDKRRPPALCCLGDPSII